MFLPIALLVLMYVFTQRLFPVPYEWLRLGQAALLAAALVAFGELLLPTDGLDGLAGRTAVWLVYPAVLYFTGFLSERPRPAADARGPRGRAARRGCAHVAPRSRRPAGVG